MDPLGQHTEPGPNGPTRTRRGSSTFSSLLEMKNNKQTNKSSDTTEQQNKTLIKQMKQSLVLMENKSKENRFFSQKQETFQFSVYSTFKLQNLMSFIIPTAEPEPEPSKVLEVSKKEGVHLLNWIRTTDQHSRDPVLILVLQFILLQMTSEPHNHL